MNSSIFPHIFLLQTSLKVIQYFVQNSDGSYVNIENPEACLKKMDSKTKKDVSNKKNFVNIRPGYLVTYLKVGKLSEHDNVPVPFCLEWIPDILPISKVGELTLKFRYGHKNNYHPNAHNV